MNIEEFRHLISPRICYCSPGGASAPDVGQVDISGIGVPSGVAAPGTASGSAPSQAAMAEAIGVSISEGGQADIGSASNIAAGLAAQAQAAEAAQAKADAQAALVAQSGYTPIDKEGQVDISRGLPIPSVPMPGTYSGSQPSQSQMSIQIAESIARGENIPTALAYAAEMGRVAPSMVVPSILKVYKTTASPSLLKGIPNELQGQELIDFLLEHGYYGQDLINVLESKGFSGGSLLSAMSQSPLDKYGLPVRMDDTEPGAYADRAILAATYQEYGNVMPQSIQAALASGKSVVMTDTGYQLSSAPVSEQQADGSWAAVDENGKLIRDESGNLITTKDPPLVVSARGLQVINPTMLAEAMRKGYEENKSAARVLMEQGYKSAATLLGGMKLLSDLASEKVAALVKAGVSGKSLDDAISSYLSAMDLNRTDMSDPKSIAYNNYLALQNAAKEHDITTAKGLQDFQNAILAAVNPATGFAITNNSGLQGQVFRSPVGDFANNAAPGIAMTIQRGAITDLVFRNPSDPFGSLFVFSPENRGAIEPWGDYNRNHPELGLGTEVKINIMPNTTMLPDLISASSGESLDALNKEIERRIQAYVDNKTFTPLEADAIRNWTREVQGYQGEVYTLRNGKVISIKLPSGEILNAKQIKALYPDVPLPKSVADAVDKAFKPQLTSEGKPLHPELAEIKPPYEVGITGREEPIHFDKQGYYKLQDGIRVPVELSTITLSSSRIPESRIPVTTPVEAGGGYGQVKLMKDMDGKGEGIYYQSPGKTEKGDLGIFEYYLVRKSGDDRLKADPLEVWIKAPEGVWIKRSIASLSHCSATECGTETAGYQVGIGYLNKYGWPDAYDSPQKLFARPGGYLFDKYDTNSYADQFQTTPEAILEQIPNDKGLSILQFGYEGCGGCEVQLKSMLGLLRDKYGFNNPNLHYYYIDTNSPKGAELTDSGEFSTTSVPLTVMYVDGKKIESDIGKPKVGAYLPIELTNIFDKYGVQTYSGAGSKGEMVEGGQIIPPPTPIPPKEPEENKEILTITLPEQLVRNDVNVLYSNKDGTSYGIEYDGHRYVLHQAYDKWGVCNELGCGVMAYSNAGEALQQAIGGNDMINNSINERVRNIVATGTSESEARRQVQSQLDNPAVKWDQDTFGTYHLNPNLVIVQKVTTTVGKEMPTLEAPYEAGITGRDKLIGLTSAKGEEKPKDVGMARILTPREGMPSDIFDTLKTKPIPSPVISSPVADEDATKYQQGKQDFDNKVSQGIWVSDGIFAGYDNKGEPFTITQKQYDAYNAEQKTAFDKGGIAGVQALITRQNQALSQLAPYKTTQSITGKGTEMMPIEGMGGTLLADSYNIVKYAMEARDEGKAASEIQQTLHNAGFKDDKIQEVMQIIPPDQYLSDKAFNSLAVDTFKEYADSHPNDPRVKYTPPSLPVTRKTGEGILAPEEKGASFWQRTWAEANRNVQFEGKPWSPEQAYTYANSVYNDYAAQLGNWVEKSKEALGEKVPLAIEINKVFQGINLPKIVIANDPAIMQGMLLNPSLRIGDEKFGISISRTGLSVGGKPPSESEKIEAGLKKWQEVTNKVGEVIPFLGAQEGLDKWLSQDKEDKIKTWMYGKPLADITANDIPVKSREEAEKIYNQGNFGTFMANIVRSAVELVKMLPEIPLVIAKDLDQLAEGDKAKLMDVVATAGGILLAIPAITGETAGVLAEGNVAKGYGMLTGSLGAMLISPSAIYRGTRAGVLDLYSAVRGLKGKEVLGLNKGTDITYARIPDLFEAIEGVSKVQLDKIYRISDYEVQKAELRKLLNPENQIKFDAAIHLIENLKDVPVPSSQLDVGFDISQWVKTFPDKDGAAAVKAVLQKHAPEGVTVSGSFSESVQLKGVKDRFKSGDIDITVPDSWSQAQKEALTKELTDAYNINKKIGSDYKQAGTKIYSDIMTAEGGTEKGLEVHNRSQFLKLQRILGFEKILTEGLYKPVNIDGVLFDDIRSQLFRRGREVVRPSAEVGEAGLAGVRGSSGQVLQKGTTPTTPKMIERFSIDVQSLIDDLKAKGDTRAIGMQNALDTILKTPTGEPRAVGEQNLKQFIEDYLQPAQIAILRASLESKPTVATITIPKESQGMVDTLASFYGFPSTMTEFKISPDLLRSQGLYKEKIVGGQVVDTKIEISKLNKYLKSEKGQFETILHELVHNSKIDENPELMAKIGKIIEEADQKTGVERVSNPWQSDTPVEIAVSEVVTDLYTGKLLGTQTNKGYPISRLHDYIAKTYGETDSLYGTKVADSVINEIKNYVNQLPRHESFPTINQLSHRLREAGVNVTDGVAQFAEIVGNEGTLKRELTPIQQRQPMMVYHVARNGDAMLEAAKQNKPIVSGYNYDKSGNLIKAEGEEIYYGLDAAFDRAYDIKKGEKGSNPIVIATQIMPEDIGTVFRQNTKTDLLRQSKKFTVETPFGDITPGGFETFEIWPEELALKNGERIYFQRNAKGEIVQYDTRHPESRDKIPMYITTTERGKTAGLKPPDDKLVKQVAFDALKSKFTDLKNIHLTKKIVVNKEYSPIGRTGLFTTAKETPYEFAGSKTILPKSQLLEKGIESLQSSIDGIILKPEGMQTKGFKSAVDLKQRVESIFNLGDLREKSKRTKATKIVKDTIRTEEKARTGENKLSNKEIERVTDEYLSNITKYVEPYAMVEIKPKPTIITPKGKEEELTAPSISTMPSVTSVPTKEEPVITPIAFEKPKTTIPVTTEKVKEGGMPSVIPATKTIPTTGITTTKTGTRITTTIPLKKEIPVTTPITTTKITTTTPTTGITKTTPRPTEGIVIKTKHGYKFLTNEQLQASIAWKQGKLQGNRPLYKLWFPPYGQKDIHNSLTAIEGVEYKEGLRSAYESAKVLFGGDIPNHIQRTMGVVNIHAYRGPDKTKPVLHFDEIYNKPKSKRHSHKELPQSSPSLGSVR